MIKCPFCNDYENENLNSLRIHNQKRHKKTALELRLALFHDNIRPKCKCGCGEETRFQNVYTGFNDFVRGHQARVNNNWGHNKTALDKSHATNKARLASGENVIWNKGLTKEDHQSVVAYGRGTAESFTEEKRERYSKTMHEKRRDGTIPTVFGTQSSQWKGGVSTVQQLSRSYVYSVWTFPKLKEQNFTCQHCGTHDNLCVHHDDERFAEILQKARVVLGDVTDETNFSLIQAYAQWVADYHVKNNVSGIVLCEKCHSKEHATLVI